MKHALSMSRLSGNKQQLQQKLQQQQQQQHLLQQQHDERLVVSNPNLSQLEQVDIRKCFVVSFYLLCGISCFSCFFITFLYST